MVRSGAFKLTLLLILAPEWGWAVDVCNCKNGDDVGGTIDCEWLLSSLAIRLVNVEMDDDRSVWAAPEEEEWVG